MAFEIHLGLLLGWFDSVEMWFLGANHIVCVDIHNSVTTTWLRASLKLVLVRYISHAKSSRTPTLTHLCGHHSTVVANSSRSTIQDSGSVLATMEYVIVQHSPSDHNEPFSTPPHTTQDLPVQLTLIKINSVTTEPYTTHHKFQIESCSTMGEEMKQYILGPMPTRAFLDEFFPLNHLHNLKKPTHRRNCYVTTIGVKTEIEAYKPFVSPLCTLILLYLLYHVDHNNPAVYQRPEAN